MRNDKDENKIVIATRTKKDGYKKCVEILENLSKTDSVSKSYIICNLGNEEAKKENKKYKNKIEVIPDSNPISMTAFNLVIKRLNDELKKDKEGNKYHLLTFSKEVDLQEENIERMIKEIEKERKTVVVGYRLKDNMLSKEEYRQFAGGSDSDNYGIAYQVPWNTCALWNQEFIYNEGKNKLIFDKICEGKKNSLGPLYVKVNGVLVETEFKGMEDGLAIAGLVSEDENLRFKLIDDNLPWKIDEDFKMVMKYKIKMARKNIVLSTFMNIKGYSIDKLMKAKIDVSK